ncbi:MAG: T9SS type A sorting domain-containing protein, partial [Mucilaginibacter sp.]
LKGGSLIYRGYRLLSSPVYASTVASNNVYSINYVQKSCYITGTTGTTGGFDKAGNPTLYFYRENLAPSGTSFMSGNFRGVNNITTSPTYLIDGDAGSYNLPVGDGFLFFFRGNRSTSLASKTTAPYSTPENTILTATGGLNQGQITVHDWYTPSSANLGYTTTTGNDTIRGYNLVGNPYASSINWDLFNTTTSTSGIYGSNIRNIIYVLDPVSKNFGVYIAGSGGVGTHNTSSILPSGQGFFVIATNSSAQLVFNESAKVNTQVTGNNLLMGIPVNYASNQYLRLQVAADSVNTDDIIIHFNSSATTAYNANIDAPYKQGFGTVSLASMSSDHVALAINTVPLPTKSETISLNVNATVSGSYKLNIKDIAAVPDVYGLSLIDKYAHDTVDMRKTAVYSFTINKTDTSSFGANRFVLVIGQIPSEAYQLLSFSATKISSSIVRQVQLTWSAINEQNYTNFTVERSIDKGKTYNVIGSIHSSGEGQYGILDSSPAVGENLYRLAQQGVNDSVTYSKVVTVEYAPLSNGITSNNVSVYPNPVSSVINLAVTTKDANTNASYRIKITNNLGLIVKEFNSSYEQWQGNVSDLVTGTYFVQVVNINNQYLVGKTKFIKL